MIQMFWIICVCVCGSIYIMINKICETHTHREWVYKIKMGEIGRKEEKTEINKFHDCVHFPLLPICRYR